MLPTGPSVTALFSGFPRSLSPLNQIAFWVCEVGERIGRREVGRGGSKGKATAAPTLNRSAYDGPAFELGMRSIGGYETGIGM